MLNIAVVEPVGVEESVHWHTPMFLKGVPEFDRRLLRQSEAAMANNATLVFMRSNPVIPGRGGPDRDRSNDGPPLAPAGSRPCSRAVEPRSSRWSATPGTFRESRRSPAASRSRQPVQTSPIAGKLSVK